jgi:hypothetical protein
VVVVLAAPEVRVVRPASAAEVLVVREASAAAFEVQP